MNSRPLTPSKTTPSIPVELANKLSAMEGNHAPLEESRKSAKSQVISSFSGPLSALNLSFNDTGDSLSIDPAIQAKCPQLSEGSTSLLQPKASSAAKPSGRRIAAIFSGGPAPGGHNVLAGLFDYLSPQNQLLGVFGGPKGLLDGNIAELKSDTIANVRNTGGFDCLGSDRTKIKSDEQFATVRRVVQEHKIDAIIMIGGDDSNTNAALLAEYLYPDCVVVGVPKTIDGDLQVGNWLPISFGFDTASKIYAELVGNICQDTPSSRKYWHFIKLMGRSASHVSLEVALKCKPALTFISEEVAEKRQSLPQLIDELARIVLRRGLKGINHGVVVIPEGLIEHIPECQELIDCLNQNAPDPNQPLSDVQKTLPGHLHALWNQIPESFQSLLSFTRDSHGNLPVSQLDTERLLADMAADRIRQLSNQRTELETLLGQPLSDEEFANAQNYKFQAQSHFFGYEGRCGLPSTFDADYSYNLGIVAAALALEKRSGYMASVSELSNGGTGYGIPLLPLLHMENRFGVDTAVIEKFTVKLDSPAFQYFVERRETWAEEDHFASPGPRQYQGPCAQDIPFTVALNQGYTSYQYQFS